jgi:uncharacterized membrane protein
MFSKKYFLSVMIALHFIGGTPILIAAAFSAYNVVVTDSNYWWNYMYKNFPSAGKVMHYCHTNDICVCGGVVLGASGTILIATISLGYLMFVLLGSWYIYRCLKKQSKMITNKKYNREKMLILSLFLQVTNIYRVAQNNNYKGSIQNVTNFLLNFTNFFGVSILKNPLHKIRVFVLFDDS